jgi:hypothetical protein
MLRDGAAWYSTSTESAILASEQQIYQESEASAKSEKRGVWGIPGLKPAWEFRIDKMNAAAAAERSSRQTRPDVALQRELAGPAGAFKAAKVILPAKMAKVTYIDGEKDAPKGFVVVGVGSLENKPDKVMKAIKKPETGDVVCTEYAIPASFVATSLALSQYCPPAKYGNNASLITDAESYTRSVVQDVMGKLIKAYRMYRVSGNYEEFELRAVNAIEAANSSLYSLPESNMKMNLLKAADALKDAMIVKNSRRGNYGTGLSGSMLLALNDKYGLDDVSESILDREIVDVGLGYLNAAGKDAIQLGVAEPRKH